MKIVKKICTNSDCYKANQQITVKGLMLHSVGCNQPDANVFQRQWDKPDWEVCPHAVIGAKADVIQTLPWNWRGWHGGGSSNNTHIGVEMTEPDTIRYTGGANWSETGDGSNTKKHVLSTYNTAVELFAYLCKKFSLNPLEDGVIVSHSEGNKRGIASAHADVEHLWRKFGLSMNKFREDVSAMLNADKSKDTKPDKPAKKPSTADTAKDSIYTVKAGDNLTLIADKFGVSVSDLVEWNDIDNPDLIHVGDKLKVSSKSLTAANKPKADKPIDTSKLTKIMGESVATAYQLDSYAKKVGVPEGYQSLGDLYINSGKYEGVRGDIAFAQSMLETGNFKFTGDVSAEQNNFAGLGATGNGVHGESFISKADGVLAQIQHLKAYASTEKLSRKCRDTRFEYVERGSAPYVEWLGIPDNPNGKGWAATKGYGNRILAILAEILKLPKLPPIKMEDDSLYRVRLSWDDDDSQIGAFARLEYAQALADVRPEYKVFDSKGKIIYEAKKNTIVEDISVTPYMVDVPANTAVYEKPSGSSAVVQKISPKGVFTIVAENSGFGKLKSGVGYVDLSKVSKTKEELFKPYCVRVVVQILNIRDKPNGVVVGGIKDKGIYTIVEENSGWGRLKSGAGWVNLTYTEKC